MDYLALTCRCVVGLAFLVSAVSKVRNRKADKAFVAAVREMTGTARPLLLARGVVAVELAIVALVAIPFTVAVGSAVAAGALVAFSVLLWGTIRRRQAVSCNCFGVSTAPVGPASLVRNGILLATAITAGVTHLGGGVGVDAAAAVLCVIVAAVVVVLVVSAEDIGALFASPPKAR